MRTGHWPLLTHMPTASGANHSSSLLLVSMSRPQEVLPWLKVQAEVRLCILSPLLPHDQSHHFFLSSPCNCPIPGICFFLSLASAVSSPRSRVRKVYRCEVSWQGGRLAPCEGRLGVRIPLGGSDNSTAAMPPPFPSFPPLSPRGRHPDPRCFLLHGSVCVPALVHAHWCPLPCRTTLPRKGWRGGGMRAGRIFPSLFPQHWKETSLGGP